MAIDTYFSIQKEKNGFVKMWMEMLVCEDCFTRAQCHKSYEHLKLGDLRRIAHLESGWSSKFGVNDNFNIKPIFYLKKKKKKKDLR